MNKPAPCQRCGYCGFIEDADMNLAGVCPDCNGAAGACHIDHTNHKNMETNEENNDANSLDYKEKTKEYDWMPEARIYAAECWMARSTHHKDIDPVLAEEVAKQIAFWIQTAAQAQRNTDYYRNLLERCGKAIGERAHVCDDGSLSESVLCAKIPEIIEEDYDEVGSPKEQIADARQIADDLWEMLKDCWTAMRSARNRMDTIRETNPEIALDSDMAQLEAHLPHLGNPYTDSDMDSAIQKFRLREKR